MLHISGPQLSDVGQALDRSHHVGSRTRHGRIVRARHPVAAHAGGEVDHHVGVTCPHPLHDVTEQRRVPAPLAGLGVADVDVDDCRAGPGGLDGRIGDLFRSHGDPRMPARRVARAGHRAGHHHLVVHAQALLALPPLRSGHSASRRGDDPQEEAFPDASSMQRGKKNPLLRGSSASGHGCDAGPSLPLPDTRHGSGREALIAWSIATIPRSRSAASSSKPRPAAIALQPSTMRSRSSRVRVGAASRDQGSSSAGPN